MIPTIYMPPTLEPEHYAEIVPELIRMHSERENNEPIYINCTGDGGDINTAFGIAGIITTIGNVVGVVSGMCTSAHSVVWASCDTRYVAPFSAMQVHSTSVYVESDYVNMAKAQYLSNRLTVLNNKLADMYYRCALSIPPQKWLEYIDTPQYELRQFWTDELIDIKFAKPLIDLIGVSNGKDT